MEEIRDVGAGDSRPLITTCTIPWLGLQPYSHAYFKTWYICNLFCKAKSRQKLPVRHGEAVASDLAKNKKEMDEHGGTWWDKHPDRPDSKAGHEGLRKT